MEHIKVAIEFAELIRTTLGPRGMNKLVMGHGVTLTNDGATIVKNIKGGNPIVDLFKNLAESQENAIGDGTTTAIILAGQLLQNALNLMNKRIHPTTIITGYTLARMKAIHYLQSRKEPGESDKIIRTAFGTKIPEDIISHLSKIIQKVKDFQNLRRYKIADSDALESELFNGFVFPGFTINERMKNHVSGRIAILDFPSNLELDNFHVTSEEELEKVTRRKKEFKKEIVDELLRQDITCAFYTDTNPEFESYLTDKGITGIVIYDRDNVDGVSKSVNAKVCSCIEDIKNHWGFGDVKYVKQTSGNKGHIFVSSEKSGIETIIIKGPTIQTLEEIERAVLDVLSLLKHDTQCVTGAGAIETSLALNLREYATQVGGKEQLAVEAFAEAVESIPLIIAENAGLDAIEILTNLKTLHKGGQTDMGVDVIRGISNAKERGIIEPVLVKVHAINAASNVATLILKTDKILLGEDEKGS
jgi:chaperonin GroEL (HSP60 family)